MLEEFKKIGRRLFQEGLVSSHAGNLSIRIDDKIFITKTESVLAELGDEDIIEVALNGEGESDHMASSALQIHRAIYKNSSAKAILHAHPPNAIALSILEDRIHPQDVEGRSYMKNVPVLRVRDPLSADETAKIIPSFLNDRQKLCVVKGHGTFAIGETLEEAYQITSAIACSCKITLLTKGVAPPPRKEERHRPPHHRPPHHGGHKKPAIPHGIGIMGRRVNYHKR